jgi:hypothetical protein
LAANYVYLLRGSTLLRQEFERIVGEGAEIEISRLRALLAEQKELPAEGGPQP